MKKVKMGLIKGRHEMPVEQYVLESVEDPADIMTIRKAVADRLSEVF
jgi:hypothetical protein